MELEFPSVNVLPLGRYAALLGPERMQAVTRRVSELVARLTGRVVWNVSSTAVGGGVAEMVRSLLAYARGAGVDARWVVMRGTAGFFQLTKRIHNAIHGCAGDGSPLGAEAHAIYQHVSRENLVELAPLVRPGDVVIVHDPQPAGMVTELSRIGARVIWRCHIGNDERNDQTDLAWSFLARYLLDASAYVFSRAAYLPPQLDARRAHVVTPSLDPFSAKNQFLDEDSVRGILVRAGLLAGEAHPPRACFLREDGTPGRVDRLAEVLRGGRPPSPATPLLVQVSRWDRLKDPVGVLAGFARIPPAPSTEALQLVLAGPDTRSVADDPEGAAVYAEVVATWQRLPDALRSRVHLVLLPTTDVDENAAIVNALQRHAAIVVQKSLQEGFGLTVAEAQWKGRPVIASAVGGILDQVEDGVTGLLLADPRDLDAFAAAVIRLREQPMLARRLAERGRLHVLERFLGVDALLRHGAVIEQADMEAAGVSLPW